MTCTGVSSFLSTALCTALMLAMLSNYFRGQSGGSLGDIFHLVLRQYVVGDPKNNPLYRKWTIWQYDERGRCDECVCKHTNMSMIRRRVCALLDIHCKWLQAASGRKGTERTWIKDLISHLLLPLFWPSFDSCFYSLKTLVFFKISYAMIINTITVQRRPIWLFHF